jgi:hypothetical protein
VILAAAAITLGFAWPPGGQDSRRHEMFWFGIGGQCWCLLFAVLTIIFVGIARASNQAGSERTREGPDRT